MRTRILFLILLFFANSLAFAQKRDPTPSVKTPAKITTAKTVDPKQLNQKLLKLQSAVKKLEGILNEAVREMDKLKDTKDSISEINREDMFWLQQFMDQKSKLEQMISNAMKAASEVQSNISKNLKSS